MLSERWLQIRLAQGVRWERAIKLSYNQSLTWMYLELSWRRSITFTWLWYYHCCVFRTAFGCCVHPKAGWNIFFNRFSTFFVHFKPFSVISHPKSTKNCCVFWPANGCSERHFQPSMLYFINWAGDEYGDECQKHKHSYTIIWMNRLVLPKLDTSLRELTSFSVVHTF